MDILLNVILIYAFVVCVIVTISGFIIWLYIKIKYKRLKSPCHMRRCPSYAICFNNGNTFDVACYKARMYAKECGEFISKRTKFEENVRIVCNCVIAIWTLFISIFMYLTV